MEEVSVENAKVSDSGYSNVCSDNSQSQRSGSSISRNSNRSESSGYCGRCPSTFGSSNEALPQPISKRKDKEHKKKKSKAIATFNPAEAEAGPKTVVNKSLPEITSYNAVAPANTVLDKKSEEITTIELVDATDPGEHNDDTVVDRETGLASRTIPLDDSTSQANEGFCAVISMHDGLVLYTTPSICTALGYLKDAWIGRSFIDYVHPKDKTTLADQITSGIASPQEESKGINGRRASLFCGLRRFTRCTMPNGYRADARSNLYLPFHLTLSFRDRTTEQQPSNRAMFLVVTAQPVHSAYKAPEETIISSVFTTRHTATCHLSHVDPDVVQYFGYLPQDMVGRSLFDFYHPEDLPFIKDIYETVIKLEGSSFRSKPYRFAVQNGGCVVLETEWSSFINPWTKKLEFVVGQHRVLKGPVDPDIFRVPRDTECGYLASISEEVLKEAKIIQGEIRALLDESIHRTSDITELDVSKRCKDLASFMESLLQETKAPGVGKDGLLAADELRSFSGSRNPLFQEHDSVMLGEISPHHEDYDSKSSTETPPSYNQLNYNENIERFFKSKPPCATMYGSDEENVNSSNDEGARKCMSPINGSGASGSGSAENLSSGSNNQTSSASRGDASNTASNSNTTATESFKPPTLTESLLNRHNEDMEKLMMQKHRELRSSIKNSDKLKDSRIKTEKVNGTESGHYVNQGHGIKRSGSHSWEGDSFKVSKHDKISRTSTAGPANLTTTVTSMSVDQSTVIQTRANINLWPPLSVTVPSSAPIQPTVPPQNTNSEAVPRFPLLPSMIPVYYMPVPQPSESTTTVSPSQEKLGSPPSAQSTQQNPYMFAPVSYVATAMAGMIYPAMIGAPPPRTMMYRPFLIPEQAPATTRENQQPTPNDKCPDHKRPASQATSVKAEPGSIMAMSESSKKVLSPGELFSSCVSNDGGCSSVVDLLTPVIVKDHRRPSDYNGDESSSSSFYSSLLYKSDSSCNPDQKTCEVSSEVENQTAQCSKDVHGASRSFEHTKCHQGMRRRDPSWLEGVQLTPELIYEYQMHPKTLNEVLKADLDAMKNFNQPLLVNDQLGQLYLDLEVEGFGTELILEDGITSSGSDSGSSNGSWTESQRKRRRMVKYGKLVMIHEENAPLPPPIPSQTISCQHS
ncbi:PREDICTED: period circadian protein isoform X3 [Wasmannia auropunctata]|uniref:period circadian protein isoform X3 n=1 Tax=Wasmannia auropunctata TaxID=64793 RepID=UPI0005EE334B|nr:PREDICTED: period circadian protein isoform X3 [Wasmannia auropunctata]